MDDRKLTLIVVPHGDLETRNYEISYPKLRFALGLVVLLLLVFVVIVGMWFPVAAQALRAGKLEQEVARLEAERASVAELARTLAEVEAQYERVRELLGADAPVGDNPPMLPPLRRDTTARGEAPEPVSHGIVDTWPLAARGFITRALSDNRPNHPGLDIAVPENSYIRAAGPGRVTSIGTDAVYGNYVVIEHADGLETLYGHASRLLVRAGDVVQGSEVIGLTGSTGQSTGPHLHFEVRRHGRAIDPLLFVRQP